MRRLLLALPLFVLLLVPAAQAGQSSLPGCEAPAAVRKAIKDQLHSPDRLSYADGFARRQRLLPALEARFPRALEPYLRRIADARDYQLAAPSLLTELQKEYRSRATAHPDDPLALYIAADALYQTDTPESIRMLQQAQSLAPAFPWPALELAQIYEDGKFADKAKFSDELTKFWTTCPTSTDNQAHWMLVRNPGLQAKVAATLRPMLAKSTDPDRLKNYEFLWGLEFRTSSPQEFPAIRQRIAADVERLEHIKNPHPDAEWVALPLHGDKQAEAAPEVIRKQEDAILASFPDSVDGQNIFWSRWQKGHPKPADQADTAGWKAYHEAWWSATQQRMKQFPDDYFPVEYSRFDLMPGDVPLTEEQGVAIARQAVNDAIFPPPMRMWGYTSVAFKLLDKGLASDKALDYMLQAKQWQEREQEQYRAQDNHSESDISEHAKNARATSRYLDGPLLLAAMRAHRPDAITPAMKASIEAARDADDKDESGYWLRRARLAAIEDRSQDSLAYYQQSLRTRTKPPGYEEGKKQPDQLTDEAHALWTKLGGTEVAWTAWSAPSATPNAAKADEARWEKPTKPLPGFKLADLSGKTWTAQSLNGKVVLINLWATWCGPCNAELPQLQKLYEQAKGRSDLQILTFDVDEDLGLVEPYLKEKGYTFPVVPAYSYVVNLLDGYAIPQNWVLNAKGNWEWTQVGYGSDDAWVKDMLAKLDAVKAGG